MQKMGARGRQLRTNPPPLLVRTYVYRYPSLDAPGLVPVRTNKSSQRGWIIASSIMKVIYKTYRTSTLSGDKMSETSVRKQSFGQVPEFDPSATDVTNMTISIRVHPSARRERRATDATTSTTGRRQTGLWTQMIDHHNQHLPPLLHHHKKQTIISLFTFFWTHAALHGRYLYGFVAQPFSFVVLPDHRHAMDELTIPNDVIAHELPGLHKASRAGGPVRCVCIRQFHRKRQNPSTIKTTPELVRIWALGSYLYCSCGRDKDELLVFPQIQGGSIHGVSFRDDATQQNDLDVESSFEATGWDAVVYGGKQLAFCSILLAASEGIAPKMRRLDIHHDGIRKQHLIVSDWIWDVKLLVDVKGQTSLDGRTCTVVLGLARHTIELWGATPYPIDDASSLQVTCRRRIAGSLSCLVMSMDMLQQNDRVWVAAGTAYQVIQVWSVPLHDQEEAHMFPNYCLEGHAGVIHSVQFSQDGKYIASTSDDRSVRLWSCAKSLSSEASCGEIWVGWGHTSRVWSVAFSFDVVVSVAEDATARIWSTESGAALACIQHSSGLWSIAVWHDIALVGATDGTAVEYNMSKRIPGRELEILESIRIPDDRPPKADTSDNVGVSDTLPSDLESTTKKKKKSRKVPAQVIVGMKWIHDGKILVATRAGSLITLNMETQEWTHCEPWWVSKLLEDHGISATDGCCMEIFGDWVAIGTTRGYVVVIKCGPKSHEEKTTHSVLTAQSLKSVKGLTWIAGQRILVSYHIRSVALWIFPEESYPIASMPYPSIVLNMDTNGVPMTCAYDDDHRQMLVGDSRGNIALFEIPGLLPEKSTSNIDASSLLPRVHHKEHVTSIVLVGDRIISSGNDGCLHYSYRNGLTLQRGLSISVWSMSGITRIWLHSETCIAAGYYGNTFRVLDVSSGYEFFQLKTGGRQQIHDLFVSKTGLQQTAVCVSQKDGTNSMMIHQEIETSGNPRHHEAIGDFQNGVSIHGETIFDACFFSLGTQEAATFLFTASEDCGSKISLCCDKHLTHALALTPQESCVRTVCTSQIDRSSALLAVGGGKLALQFFVARAGNKDGLSVRALDDVVICFLGKGHGFASSDATVDQRINVAKGIPLDGPGRTHLVVAGDSAGQCHVYIISEDTSVRPSPGLVVPISARPILCLAISLIQNRILLAVGTTAGDIQLYDLPGSATGLLKDWSKLGSSPWRSLATFQAHQMGTNTISLSIETTGATTAHATIFSGGDDQSVSLFQLELRTDVIPLVAVEPYFTTTVRDASFSAVKGVSGPFHLNCKYFLSTGYTQQLALWRLVESQCDDRPRLEVAKHLPVDVGDVNTLATHVGEHSDGILAAVAGLGIELFCLIAS